ncbi:anillin isoform X2 [Lucilia sericata]|uniref:anillin isoform X2 n=1 Tax=Lucilia sericata TaxID=13632 RepID=UPI0018A8679F|nr:anillin isoform X2 [Lucilia sericata]
MDPFTQRMLEKAEQRSRALGISNADVSKFPVCDKEASSNFNALSGACATTMAMASQQQQQQKPMHTIVSADGSGANKNRLNVIEKNNKDKNINPASPQKILRQFSAVDKENMDLGIEINIVTDKNVEVQVQVEEQDCSSDEERKEVKYAVTEQKQDQPSAKIRDTSRNRLQRLGALYSNTDDLSSPIHRTEGKFHAEGNEDSVDSQLRKPNQRLGKLAALANTINQWEDDTSHHGTTTQPPPKPELPSRGRVAIETQNKTTVSQPEDQKSNSNENNKIKQLKWDPKVINSLEAQGFQRRESSTVKVSYEFAESKDSARESACTTTDKPKEDISEEKRVVGKLNANKFASMATNAAAEKKVQQNEKKLLNVKPGLVSGRAAIFESQVQNNQLQQQKPQKDPTELSLKERMKLFEKNKGEALVPKAAFGMAPPISKIIQDTNHKKDELTKAKPTVHSRAEDTKNATTPVPVVKTFVDSKVRDKVTALVNATTGSTIKDDIKKQREEDLQLIANRFNKQKDFLNQQQQFPTPTNKSMPTPPPPPPPMSTNTTNITAKRRSHNKRPRKSNQGTQQRLYPVLPSFESNESCESDNENNCCTTASVSAQSTADEMQASTQPLRGHNNDQYHQRSDDENEDSYMESDAEDSSVGLCNGSLGREIMQVVESNDKQVNSKVKEVRYAEKDHYFDDHIRDASINSSDASMGVDDYLDEALDDNVDEEDEDDSSQLSRDSKGTTASNSFSFRKVSTETDYKNTQDGAAISTTTTTTNNASYMQPVKSELSVNKESDNVVTLVHTVSFYRRQQSANSANSTPIRKICREQQVLRSAMEKLDAKAAATGTSLHFEPDTEETDEDTQSDSEVDDANMVQDKIKKLLEEVCKQQQVIAQTSQALNLCAATIEFSGSTESVEGERHLLVATHRRQACLDEVQRLRVEKTLRPVGAPREKGRLTVKEITIPLRQDYIRKLSLDTISGHHLVCLIKYNEHVLATKTVPTLPGLLAVKFPDVLQLNNVYADFKVTLEIYGMTAQREVLPHEVKYHINCNKKSGLKTPKKKASENRLVMPPVQSPAGPHAVRTPALVQYGFAIFSLREIQRTSWTLTQVLGVSPLEGVVHMKVNCELSVSVEYKGFLTMFEDISGFGAWHRRWCHLNGTMLNYWKYPDDEKKKAPMGSIDLYTCSSLKVNIAPRDICARLNTMLLECQRPAKDTDQESLIIVPNGRTTTVRYLLSADTKEEREEWCAYFNKTLTLLRAWGPPQ